MRLVVSLHGSVVDIQEDVCEVSTPGFEYCRVFRHRTLDVTLLVIGDERPGPNWQEWWYPHKIEELLGPLSWASSDDEES